MKISAANVKIWDIVNETESRITQLDAIYWNLPWRYYLLVMRRLDMLINKGVEDGS